jgi:hypothetical protein
MMRVMFGTVIAIVLASSAIPLAKVGSCPSNNASESGWCVPMKSAKVAVPKGHAPCPSTMMASGAYCIEKR